MTDNPPWRVERPVDRPFTCVRTDGLLEDVSRAMTKKTVESAGSLKAYQNTVVRKLVRDAIIDAASHNDTLFKQKPSKSLLYALMDLVDMQGAELECMSTEDRAGIKQFRASLMNYTLFYIPNKTLRAMSNNRIVVPVATMWEHTSAEELRFCDEARSRLATYAVLLDSASSTYFMQQVMAVPSLQCLKVLQAAAGDQYHFWDMSAEVPTHPDALTPFFKQIQPSQVFPAEDKDKERATQSTQDSGGDQDMLSDTIQPMCCVLDKESEALQIGKRSGSVDCFSDEEILCDLTRFKVNAPVSKTMYVRRTGRVLGRKRGNLIAVVSPRESQQKKDMLYVSTTARFCRAIKYSCVKGSGELLKCCHTKINELACRETFLTGPELHQDIIHSAITAFAKRVCPPASNWCSYTPRHVLAAIKHPIMSSIVEAGVKLLDVNIPNAFMIAELLLSSKTAAVRYLDARERYATDREARVRICQNNIAHLKSQFAEDQFELINMAAKITVGKHQRQITRELFKSVNAKNINDVFKQWQQMNKQQQQPKDKESATKQSGVTTKESVNAKVFFCNLRTYLAKMSKIEKIAAQGADATSSSASKSSDSTGSADSPTHNEDLRVSATPESPSEKPWYLSMIIPDNPPLGAWIRNMGTLLQSAPWLHADSCRREAVCSVLGLTKAAVCNKYAPMLTQWASNNPTVVEQLKSHKMDDTLSSALIRLSDNMSHDSWVRNVDLAFSKQAVSAAKAPKRARKAPVKRAADTKVTRSDPAKSARQNLVKDFFCQEASSGEEETDGEQSEDELACKGEELHSEDHYDRGDLSGDDEEEDLDEYDLNDDFIDDRSEYSVEEDSDDQDVHSNRKRRKPTRRVIARSASDTDSDQTDCGRSVERRGPAKISKRRTQVQDAADEQRHKDAGAPSHAGPPIKKIRIRVDRPAEKGHSRDKGHPSGSGAKTTAKRKFKANHGPGDKAHAKIQAIQSESDSSDYDRPPPAKREPSKSKRRASKETAAVKRTEGDRKHKSRARIYSDSDSADNNRAPEKADEPLKAKQQASKEQSGYAERESAHTDYSDTDQEDGSDFYGPIVQM